MWKAVQVLSIVSDFARLSTMVSECSDAFVSDIDCKAFVAANQDAIDDKVEAVAPGAMFQVVDYRAVCVQEPSGRAT